MQKENQSNQENEFGIFQVFNECTKCHKKLSDILINIKNQDKIKEQEKKERLCRTCAKEAKLENDVLDYEIRKYGLLKQEVGN